MEKIISLIVGRIGNGKRVDSFLNSKITEYSRNKIKQYILNGNLKVNELVSKSPSQKISHGDVILLTIPQEEKNILKPYKYKLKIIFEDGDLMVIDKSAGISIHPGAGNYEKTLVNALINYIGNNLSDINGEFRPGIVHRIDKDTSGLIVVAKNNYTHLKLSEQFKNHTVNRVYNALVWGKPRPSSGRIETLICRSKKNRQLMQVSSIKGKKAITNYKTIEIFENSKLPTFSYLECKLETGRTHQIRVHLSNKGNNIFGDKQYKKNFKKIKNIDNDLENMIYNSNRHFLHAGELGFIHPRSNKKLFFKSNLPEDLENILKKLRFT